MTREQLEALNKQRREIEAEARAKELGEDRARAAAGNCPLATGMNTLCKLDACAWYTGGGCALTCPHPAPGKRCPYTKSACADDCAWAVNSEKG